MGMRRLIITISIGLPPKNQLSLGPVVRIQNQRLSLSKGHPARQIEIQQLQAQQVIKDLM